MTNDGGNKGRARRDPFAEGPPLVEAKLAAPRPRAGIVERPRILKALDTGNGAALTLVAAPAGYGKTTAVRAWCAARGVAIAWVTLDAGDNDPARMWRYVATAVDRVREGLGRAALQRLRLVGAPIEDAVDELMNGIAAFDTELVLVLDDLQAITDTDCLASIDHALERLPASARVIVLTRSDPALRVPQLRARGALAELRADELAFTDAEARELLIERERLDLEQTEIEQLHERTEGWPAALFLAALWLRSVDDPHEAVREFQGDHRFVADYLANEAINALDHDSRSFLLRACVLGRFTPELCDAALDREDSVAALAELERSNLFVVRLAHGGWYRVHSLFAEFARFKLLSEEPDAVVDVHRRAAVWLRSHRRPMEAAQHAAAAGDHEFVAQVLLEYHLTLIRHGGARTLLDWVRALPDEQVVAHPELAVGAATAATMMGGAALERRRLLQLAGRARRDQPERFTPYVEAVEAMVRAASVDTDVGEAVGAGHRAVEVARAGADAVLVAALGGYARALFFAGRLDEAWSAALEAVEHPDADNRAPGQAFARCTLALVAVELDRPTSARTHLDVARSLSGGGLGARSWLGANASVARGTLLEAEGRLGDAERDLAHADQYFKDEVATVHHVWLLTLLARVRGRRGRLEEATATARLAREALYELADGGRVPALLADVERELEQSVTRANGGAMLETPSKAELAVLRLLTSDLSVRQIGEALFLSPNTVRSHTRSLYRKLGVNSREDAVARADVLALLAQPQSPM